MRLRCYTLRFLLNKATTYASIIPMAISKIPTTAKSAEQTYGTTEQLRHTLKGDQLSQYGSDTPTGLSYAHEILPATSVNIISLSTR